MTGTEPKRAVEPTRAAEVAESPERADAMTRRTAVAMAGHRGDCAQARAHLNDAEPAVRASALLALERAGALDAHVLAAALDDGEPAVRVTALELAAGRCDVAVDAVAARLDDGDQRVVETAAWTCGEKVSAPSADPVDPAAVVTALTRVARTHSDPLCRESAIAALGAIAHPDGLRAVLAGLDDKPAIRRRAVIALAPFDDPEVEAALNRAGNDRDKQVRAAAAELRGTAPGSNWRG